MLMYNVHFQTRKLFSQTTAKFTSGNVWIHLCYQSFSLPVPRQLMFTVPPPGLLSVAFPPSFSIMEVHVLAESQKHSATPAPSALNAKDSQSHPLQIQEAKFGISVYKYSLALPRKSIFSFLVYVFLTEDHSKDKTL